MENRARIKLIAAMGINQVIGDQNRLPWHLPAEWDYFREVTRDHIFIMGRKSYFNEDALLSEQHNYVISRQESLPISGNTSLVGSLEEALDATRAEQAVFILGGASIFGIALPYADQLYLSVIHGLFPGDAYFPTINWPEWKLVQAQRRLRDDQHSHTFSMNVYHRIKPFGKT